MSSIELESKSSVMEANPMPENSSPADSSNRGPEAVGRLERVFRPTVFFSFYWILLGLSFIYGVRIWHDAPIHSSFLPIIFVSFSVITSFIVVMTLNYVVGDIELEVFGFKFKGAAGPIILWTVCFLAIIVGLNAVSVKLDENQSSYVGTPIQELILPDWLPIGMDEGVIPKQPARSPASK